MVSIVPEASQVFGKIQDEKTHQIGQARQGAAETQIYSQPSTRSRFRPGTAHIRQIPGPRDRPSNRRHGTGPRHPPHSAVPASVPTGWRVLTVLLGTLVMIGLALLAFRHF